MTAFFVALAGAAGALARYQVSQLVGARTFPWSTLGINIAGSFLLGALVRLAAERGWPESTTVPIGAGFLGAFTTFSTFSVETHAMVRAGRPVAAVTYVTVSVVGGVLAAGAGYALARTVAA